MSQIALKDVSRLVNIKQTQQHPFHVLTSSKLPIFISILAGGLALSLIAKLHAIEAINLSAFSFVASQLLEPAFSTGSLYSFSANLTILFLMAVLTIAM